MSMLLGSMKKQVDTIAVNIYGISSNDTTIKKVIIIVIIILYNHRSDSGHLVNSGSGPSCQQGSTEYTCFFPSTHVN